MMDAVLFDLDGVLVSGSAHTLAVHPDAGDIFTHLVRAGIRTAVVTNSPTELAREIVSAVGLAPDVVIGSTDVRRTKPAPDMLLLACRRLGVSSERAVMVGDSHADRDAAAAASMHFAGFCITGDTTLAKLREICELATLVEQPEDGGTL